MFKPFIYKKHICAYSYTYAHKIGRTANTENMVNAVRKEPHNPLTLQHMIHKYTHASVYVYKFRSLRTFVWYVCTYVLMYLCIYVSMSPSVSDSLSLSLFLAFSLSVSLYLSICLSFFLSIFLSILSYLIFPYLSYLSYLLLSYLI